MKLSDYVKLPEENRPNFRIKGNAGTRYVDAFFDKKYSTFFFLSWSTFWDDSLEDKEITILD